MAAMKFNSKQEQMEVEARVRAFEMKIQMGPREIDKRIEELATERRRVSESLRMAETPEEIEKHREQIEKIDFEVHTLRSI